MNQLEMIAKHWPEALEHLDTALPFHAGAGCRFTTSAMKKTGRHLGHHVAKLRAHVPNDQIEAWRAHVGLRDVVSPEATTEVDQYTYRMMGLLDRWRRSFLANSQDLRYERLVDPRATAGQALYRHYPQAAQWLTPARIAEKSIGDPSSPLAAGIWRRYVTNISTGGKPTKAGTWHVAPAPAKITCSTNIFPGVPENVAKLPRDQPWWIMVEPLVINGDISIIAVHRDEIIAERAGFGIPVIGPGENHKP
jgi:hypothetical protein